jgi:amino acid permease
MLIHSLAAMPAAMSSMGVLMGVLMITFAGCTSGIGLYFLSRCALRIERGHSSFFAVAKRTYPEAAIVFDSAIAIKCFGTTAA